jgi:hypothetical protein
LAGLRDAYSVAPASMSSVTLAGSDSGPDRKLLSLPLGASTTALPVPLQLFSADWIREVSGGEDSALLLNCSLLVARVALSVVQVAGTDGWATARLSPVARVRLVAAVAGSAKLAPAAMRALTTVPTTTVPAANRRGRMGGCFTGQSSRAGHSGGLRATVASTGRPVCCGPAGQPARHRRPVPHPPT